MDDFPIPGALSLGRDRCQFSVWAPHSTSVRVRILGPAGRTVVLSSVPRGYWTVIADDVPPGTLYRISLDGGDERPDPASRYQPQGVHGPSAVVNPGHPWKDEAWKGLRLEDLVIYELHVGTFTPEGTFDGAIAELRELKRLGITAVELMPVAQFPGARNWGYDGTFPYAVQDSYGGPAGLKRLVAASHELGLAVILDVVYNHLGPEGNYLWDSAPYFTDHYRTPWGRAVNFDGPASDEVRHYFIHSALMFIREFHIDALRLDAVQAIVDQSVRPFLLELAQEIHETGRRLGREVHLLAESDQNDARLALPPDRGGLGLDAIWNDDFHHSLHVLLTGELQGYYRDYSGLPDFTRALSEGFVYTGQYSLHRQRRRGMSARDLESHRMIVYVQNHDQVGNRADGERLSTLVSFERLKLAAGAVLLAPGTPLLFMGEEYGEPAPFFYFVSHTDPSLIEAVRKGRLEAFDRVPGRDEAPDPASPETFARSRLDHSLRSHPRHRALWEFYSRLLDLRKRLRPYSSSTWTAMSPQRSDDEQTLLFVRSRREGRTLLVFNFSQEEASVPVAPLGESWRRVLDSSDTRWLGGGALSEPRLDLQGEVRLRLAPSSMVFYLTDALADGLGESLPEKS